MDYARDSLVEFSVAGFFLLRLMTLKQLIDVDFEFRLFSVNLLGQFLDCWMSSDNTICKSIVPSLYRIVRPG